MIEPVPELLHSLGTRTAAVLWLPLVTWTVAAIITLAPLQLARAIHPRIQYGVRLALVLALPVGIAIGILFSASLRSQPALSTLLPQLDLAAITSIGDSATGSSAQWTMARLLGLLTVLAAAAAGFRLTGLVVAFTRLRGYVRGLACHTDEGLQEKLRTFANQIGIRRTVSLRISGQIMSPMTTGFLRPVVYMPSRLLADSDAFRMSSYHELIHVRRADYPIRLVVRIIEAFFFVHPLVPIVRRSVDLYGEAVCDSEVLSRSSVTRGSYARLLNACVAGGIRTSFSLGMAEHPSHLRRRIIMMATFSNRTVSTVRVATLTAVVFSLGLAASMTAGCADSFEDDDQIFTTVDTMPEIVGGLAAVQQEIRYPASAKEAGVEGRVVIQFVVDKSGAVTDAKTVHGIGSGLDEEALRVVKATRFKPGMLNGEPVKVQLSLPISFRLENDVPKSD